MYMLLKRTKIVILAYLRPYICPFWVHFEPLRPEFWEWLI